MSQLEMRNLPRCLEFYMGIFYKIWQKTKAITGVNGFTLFTQIWNNFNYGELMKLERFDLWKTKGLR